MKRLRHILCTEHKSSVEDDSTTSVWLLPDELDLTKKTVSFDLLGSTALSEHVSMNVDVVQYSEDTDLVGLLANPQNELGCQGLSDPGDVLTRSENSFQGSDQVVKEKLIQLLHTIWLVFDFSPRTYTQGILWLGTDVVKRCLVVAEVFSLLEEKRNTLFDVEILWQHSLRTGYLAGVLTKERHNDTSRIIQSCVAGLSHDIGLAILAISLDSSRYLDVLACATRRCMSLAKAELHVLGISHEILGAEYLERRRFPKEIIHAVSFHDEPFGYHAAEFTPTIAVYAANILDGGGWPQDSDGVPSERAMEYLASHGMIDPWPKWRRHVESLHRQGFRRV